VAMTVEQQRAIALANARLRTQQQNPIEDFGEGANVGISKTLGMPVDAVNWALGPGLRSEQPVGGSDWIQSQMEGVGIPATESRGLAGAVGEGVGTGAAAMLALPGAAARSATAALTNQAPGATSTAGRIVQDIAQSAVRAPRAFTAAETMAAGSAGAGGYLLEQKYPDTPGVRALGEIAGGMTPVTIGLTLRAVGSASPTMWLFNQARGLFDSLTQRGGRRRAQDRLRRAFGDPDEVNMSQSGYLEDAPLTPVQRSQNRGLLSLERAVMDSSEALKSGRAEQLSAVNAAIRQAFIAGRANPEQTSAYFRHLIDARVQNAAESATEALLGTRPGVDRESANRVVSRELNAAVKDVRRQERDLYLQIPQDLPLGTRNATLKFERMWAETGEAQRGDFPPTARRFLNPESSQYHGEQTTLLQLRSTQSKLREEARVARANKKFNRARIADKLADAITEDIALAEGDDTVKEAVRVATQFSKDLNDRFTRGEVGRVLGYGDSGSPDGMMLENLIGGAGPQAREASDALLEASRFADKHAGTERGAVVKQHLNDYVFDKFNRLAAPSGELDVRSAMRFLNDNSELLKRHPDIAQKIQRAVDARGRVLIEQRMADPKESVAAIYLNASPGAEIDRVIGTSQPREGMRDLLALARTDASGQAESGLKQAFMRRLLRESETSGMDEADQFIVSGQRMTDDLNKPGVRQAMEGLFDEAELARIEEIRHTAIALDRARSAKPADEGIIGDTPGQITNMFARVLGAAMGRALNTGTIQAPQATSNFMSRLVKAGINDPARRLLNDAIQDEKLFRTLMDEIRTPQQEMEATRRLNAWMVGVLQEIGEDATNAADPATTPQ
jgi:hypothetical protein